MKTLLVGTAPPPGGGLARSLARHARELAAAGDEVVVLSPDLRSAAHRHARLDGLALAVYLAYYARRFDSLELCLEDGLPSRAGAGRLARAAHLRALALALRRWREVRLRLDHPNPLGEVLSTRASRALLARASEVVVLAAEDEARCATAGGLDPARVSLEVEGPDAGAPAPSALDALLAAGREPPGRGVALLVVYERLRHLVALALGR